MLAVAVTDGRDRAGHERSARATALRSSGASRGWPRRPEQHLEQIADLSPLDQGMTQGKLRYDLIPISSTLSLAQHVALVDEVGEDPVGGAFGDPDRGGDVPQSDSR
jgi:hypothetical protein